MNSSITCKRNSVIDIMKSLGMICVVLGHLGLWNIDRVVFTFHMPLFFILSGYLFNNRRNFYELLRARAKSLLVPYVSTCLIIMLIVLFRQFVLHEDLKVSSWFLASLYGIGGANSLKIPAIGAIWFLWALFWAILLYKVILSFSPKFQFIVIVIAFIIGAYTWNIIACPLSIQPALCSLIFIHVGKLLKEFNQSFSLEEKKEGGHI